MADMPKRIRVIHNNAVPFANGNVYDVVEWVNGCLPRVRATDGTEYTLYSSKWEAADYRPGFVTICHPYPDVTVARSYAVLEWDGQGWPVIEDDKRDLSHLPFRVWKPEKETPMPSMATAAMPELLTVTEPAEGCTAGNFYAVKRWLMTGQPIIEDDTGRDRALQDGVWKPGIHMGATAAVAAKPAEAGHILRKAAAIVEGSRQASHGDKERSFGHIAEMWNGYLSARRDPTAAVRARDVAQMMVLLKIVRSVQGSGEPDHFLDQAGYSALAGELASRE